MAILVNGGNYLGFELHILDSLVADLSNSHMVRLHSLIKSVCMARSKISTAFSSTVPPATCTKVSLPRLSQHHTLDPNDKSAIDNVVVSKWESLISMKLLPGFLRGATLNYVTI